MTEFMSFWRHYADFKGRTTIRGFWIAVLVYCLIAFILMITLSIVALFVMHMEPERATHFARFYVVGVYGLTSIVPLLSITVRRLHDAGYSAKSFFWLLIPGIGGIVFLIRLCSQSKQTVKTS